MLLETIFADTNFFTLYPSHVNSTDILPPIHPDIYLVGELDEQLIIHQPIQLKVTIDTDACYVVDDDIFLVYGSGENLKEAMVDYKTSLSEFYQIIERGSKLNPFDQRQLIHLQSYIRPKNQ